jgi:hypothetical protein
MERKDTGELKRVSTALEKAVDLIKTLAGTVDDLSRAINAQTAHFTAALNGVKVQREQMEAITDSPASALETLRQLIEMETTRWGSGGEKPGDGGPGELRTSFKALKDVIKVLEAVGMLSEEREASVREQSIDINAYITDITKIGEHAVEEANEARMQFITLSSTLSDQETAFLTQPGDDEAAGAISREERTNALVLAMNGVAKGATRQRELAVNLETTLREAGATLKARSDDTTAAAGTAADA